MEIEKKKETLWSIRKKNGPGVFFLKSIEEGGIIVKIEIGINKENNKLSIDLTPIEFKNLFSIIKSFKDLLYAEGVEVLRDIPSHLASLHEKQTQYNERESVSSLKEKTDIELNQLKIVEKGKVEENNNFKESKIADLNENKKIFDKNSELILKNNESHAQSIIKKEEDSLKDEHKLEIQNDFNIQSSPNDNTNNFNQPQTSDDNDLKTLSIDFDTEKIFREIDKIEPSVESNNFLSELKRQVEEEYEKNDENRKKEPPMNGDADIVDDAPTDEELDPREWEPW